MARKRRDDDDGRTIATMNVEGMPWHRPDSPAGESGAPVQLTPAEARAAMWGALKAALLIAVVFILGAFLFILFCEHVWLK